LKHEIYLKNILKWSSNLAGAASSLWIPDG